MDRPYHSQATWYPTTSLPRTLPPSSHYFLYTVLCHTLHTPGTQHRPGHLLPSKAQYQHRNTMKTATCLVVLALIACAGAVAAQRQDEALDSLMLSSNLQPVNDPIPRLLQEALESATAKPGTYGGAITTTETPATAATPPAARSGSSTAAAGVVSLAAAAAVAAMLL